MRNHLATRTLNDVVIVDAFGRFALGPGTEAIREQIWSLIERNHRKILVNLQGTSYLDSSAIGELVAAYTTVKSLGGELKLVHVRPSVHSVLAITRLHMVFEIFDDDAMAVASFHQVKSKARTEPAQYAEVHWG
jgi:anti-sigma B factor antagonist